MMKTIHEDEHLTIEQMDDNMYRLSFFDKNLKYVGEITLDECQWKSIKDYIKSELENGN